MVVLRQSAVAAAVGAAVAVDGRLRLGRRVCRQSDRNTKHIRVLVLVRGRDGIFSFGQR